jgi:16S rRNA (guanine1207-N2)-methyltransferase
MKVEFSNSFGNYNLKRYPYRENENLQAFDAADTYLLNHLFDLKTYEELKNSNILIIGDTFGALTLSLNDYAPTSQSDSFLTKRGLEENSLLNNIDPKYNFIKSTDSLIDQYNIVLIKLSKNNSYLEDNLIKLRKHITENTLFIAADMAKHIHTSTLKYFEKYIGETKTSLAVKKARLIISKPTSSYTEIKSPYPKEVRLENGHTYLNQSNVFSREKLDIGTRFFLENFKEHVQGLKILDLGCANGILGVEASLLNPNAKISFTDESAMAIASAKANALTHNKEINANYLWTDVLEGNSDKFDLILCNPPFHQQNVVGDHIAWSMFTQSAQALEKGGKILVIGNRHLGYHVKLKKLFKNCETIANNKKFVILQSIKN